MRRNEIVIFFDGSLWYFGAEPMRFTNTAQLKAFFNV